MKFVRIGIFCVFLLSLYAAYLSRENIMRIFANDKPCTTVVNYSLGDFDERFGLSKEEFLIEIKKAEKVWEDSADKELFNYVPEFEKETLAFNLIYDYRQEATNELTSTGGTIEESKLAYETAKKEYDKLTSEYNSDKEALDARISSYDKEKDEYDDKVDYWNDRGGAPSDEYKELEEERKRLNDRADRINADQKSLNALANKINTDAAKLNALGKKINLHVENYNQTVNATGEEFNEGEYIQDNEGRRINVYQFDDKNVLQRLLTHELGHAIGLDHVDNKDAIMYRLNQSPNRALTDDDHRELKSVCGV